MIPDALSLITLEESEGHGCTNDELANRSQHQPQSTCVPLTEPMINPT